MSIYDPEPKKDIILRKYPSFILLGRILSKNVEKYKETLDESLILYRFCCNGPKYIPNDDNKTRCKPGSVLTPR